jgi:hypothetical protein
MFKELSLSAQTAYSEIFDQSRANAIDSLAALSGSFHTRVIKNKRYVYFAYRDFNGAGKMIYVGPEDARVMELIDKFRLEKSHQTLSVLVQSAQVLGCQGMMSKPFKMTQQLANYGFFKAGGVLVGTHAFLAMGNMLGVRWDSGNKTLDVDFAHAGKKVSIALPANLNLSVHDALTSLEMGLLPIQQFSGKAGAQYRNPQDPELRIDFLTAMGREKENVVVNHLGLALQPLKFMEFSLEGTTQAVVMGRSDACLVNIPAPERFAMHKLIVYGERKAAERIKSVKDVAQAAALVSWHFANGMEHKIAEAWADAVSRGPGWRTRIIQGRNFMLLKHPELNRPEVWGEH